jgi:hypothetical protein
MNFFERFLPFSPDAGSGSLEMLVLLAAILTLSLGLWLGRKKLSTHH